jgi:hypothetical protein
MSPEGSVAASIPDCEGMAWLFLTGGKNQELAGRVRLTRRGCRTILVSRQVASGTDRCHFS